MDRYADADVDGSRFNETPGYRSIRLLFLVGLTAILVPACRAAQDRAPLTIAADGEVAALICVDGQATEAEGRQKERKAADDLAHYIELMTGGRPAIIDDPEGIQEALDGDAPVLVVGELALRTEPSLRRALDRVVEPDPFLTGVRSRDGVETADGIVLRRVGNRIYVAGSNTRSHYFAASRLLQIWGCRWYMPTEFGECIPQRSTLSLGDLDETYAPPFELRNYWHAWNASNVGRMEFQDRNFINRERISAGHSLGRYVRELIPEGGSAYNVPIAEPETAEHVARQLEEAFANDRAIGLGMDDGIYKSDSDLDAELQANLYDKYMQSPMLTDAFMSLYNNVAENLLERHPDSDSIIGFLTYSNITIPPQRDIRAADPLVTNLAPIDIDPNHHMDDHRSPPRQEYREMLYRWAEVMEGRVAIYDYDQGMLVWRDLPNPSHQAFRRDVKHYRDAGILGISTETRGAIATTFLNFHIRCQLMWNPDLDVDALLEEFYPNFYGPAAEPMAHYWGAIFQAWEDTIVTEHEFYVIPAIYTQELVDQLRDHLEDAKAAVATLRDKDEENLSRNERLYLDRVEFTDKSFNLIGQYTTMVREGAREGDYAAAAQAGRNGLKTRLALAQMNPTFTTRILGRWRERSSVPAAGPGAWFENEVRQYIDLKEMTDGTKGELVKQLPLHWAYRRDPHDTGLPRGFARKDADLSFWKENRARYAEPENRKDYPTTEWEMIRTDLYAQAQGILHPDWQSFTGFMWYKTGVELDAQQAEGNVHIHFPGLFSEAWLYVNGYLVEHRKQDHMWWHNSYSFNWEVDLTDKLKPGENDITVRVHNTHHNGGMFRRPFLYRPAD